MSSDVGQAIQKLDVYEEVMFALYFARSRVLGD